jgi:hypothetical protein
MLRSLFLFIALATAAAAQPLDFERQITPFPVLDAEGDPFDMPFAGAFNSPRPQLADLDGDGDPDLFVLEEQGRILYYENVGEGGEDTFAWRSDQYAEIDAGSWFHFGDLDGDGDLDMLGSNFSSRDFHLYENLGDGTFADPTSFPVSGNGSCAVFHDRDNDGDLDVTGVDEGDDLLYFYENPGPGTDAEASPEGAFAVTLYPNPARDAATVRFTLATPETVTVRVFDALGREVMTLADNRFGAGPRALSLAAKGLGSGTYLVRVETASASAVQSLTLTR